MLVLLASFSSPSWIFQIDLPYKDRVYLDRDPEERLALISRDFYEGKHVLGLGVIVRRLVKEESKEKKECSPCKRAGLSNQGSQIGTAAIEEVARPSKQATHAHSILRDFIASHSAIAFFDPPPNSPFTSIIRPI